MLVRPKRYFPGTVFLFRGSAFSHVWVYLTIIIVWSCLVTVFHPEGSSLTTTPFALIGLALSIFLGFRNNACYDRWWEARKLWGALINDTRSFTRQMHVLVKTTAEDRKMFVYRAIAFSHALRLHLRQQMRHIDELSEFLSKEEVEFLKTQGNVPNAILHKTGMLLKAHYDAGNVDPVQVPVLEDTLVRFSNIQGGCERIKNTPVPIAYTMLTHRIVGVYCFALPFGIYAEMGNYTPIVCAMVCFAFLGLDLVGSQIEDPFEEDPNDLPLLALSRIIEIELRQRLGQDDLPPNIIARDNILY